MMIHIVVIVPDNLIINVYDTSIHLLFSSTTLLEPEYHLYLIGRKREIISLIALLYIHPFRFTELSDVTSLLLDQSISHILRLDIGMFINNPHSIKLINKDDILTPEYHYNISYHSILYPSDEGILRLPSQINADVCMHSKCCRLISKLTGGSSIRISCLLIVNGTVDGVEWNITRSKLILTRNLSLLVILILGNLSRNTYGKVSTVM